jgi:hypothetical protein
MAIVYDMSTGRANVGDVMRDIGVFIEGWFTATARARNARPEKETLCDFQIASPRNPSQAAHRRARCQPATRLSAVWGGCWLRGRPPSCRPDSGVLTGEDRSFLDQIVRKLI